MARRTSAKKVKTVEDYRHDEATRPNNPPAGLAQYDSDRPPKRRFEFDPHQDPQLVWAGKAEHLSFEVEAPSIHVHERLSTEAILRSVQKEPPQPALFGDDELDRSKVIEFYQHEQGWVNRLVLGDSLVVMTSLLDRERLGGQVQMIYIDPPYGIDYKANFQPRISSTEVMDRDADLTREPEQVTAFRDTWKLGVHSYLSYLRDRLLLGRELLADTGSMFVQMGDDNAHLVQGLLDEIFGREQCVAVIAMQKSGSATSTHLPRILDYILWYAKDKSSLKYRALYEPFDLRYLDTRNYRFVEDAEGSRREMTGEEKENPLALTAGLRPYRLVTATSQHRSETRTTWYEFKGKSYWPGDSRQWSWSPEGLDRLAGLGRLEGSGDTLQVLRYLDDFPVALLRNVWLDTGRSGFGGRQWYAVQTNAKAIERCVLLATDPGDLVLDPTCGSATTAVTAEKHGRRWIMVDTSRVAVAIARERLLTAKYEFFRLQDQSRGVDAGFLYARVPHVEPGDLAYDRPSKEELLRNRPLVDNAKVRVSGPFTVEALSRYTVNPLEDDVPPEPDDAQAADVQGHVSTLLDALRKQGIPRKGAKPIPIESLQPISNAGWIQAEGTYADSDKSPKTFAVSLGPRFGPITVGQVDDTLHEAYGWDLVVFAGFAASAEAQQLVAKGQLGKFKVALLEANPDLLVGDLLKTTSSSQTFRLFSAPEAQLKREASGDFRIEVLGVDAFDASTGEVVSRGQADIAAWFLDQDYDGIVFHVNQAFFPRPGGWEVLQRTLKGTIEPELMEQLESFESLPFRPGEHKRAAVRVVDDFGTTSEAVIPLD